MSRRRQALTGLWFSTLLLLATPADAQVPAAAARFEVVLLGTGTPNPHPARFGPSTLVRAGNQNLLFDVGRGATIRLAQLGMQLGSIDQVFFTHYHSDHTVGLPDLWLTGWLGGTFGNRKRPLQLAGPVGVKRLAEGLEHAYADDLRIRQADEKLPAEHATFAVTEFEESGGVVYEREGVKVTAFANDHGDVIHPSVGYRVDYNGHSVLISGDTRPNANVVKFGRGADLLVHEVAAAPPGLVDAYPAMKTVLAHHTLAPEAGEIFAKARPRLAVYTHFVLPSAPGVAPVNPDELRRQTRERYDGPLVLGEDLMRFVIGETVEVVPWAGRP
jgi:ribonuclease Z